MEEIVCDSLFFVADSGEELLPGGKTKRVTERNKKRYLRLLIEHRLVGHNRREISYIVKGFFDIIPQSMLTSPMIDVDDHISAVDLDLLVSGMPSIDVHDWRAHAVGSLSDATIRFLLEEVDKPEIEREDRDKYTNYLEIARKLSVWFWEYIESLDVEDRAKVLLFTCGSGRLPADGFSSLRPPFKIDADMQASPSSLPTAHTCFNQLCIPNYETKAAFLEKMKLAIRYAGDGFGFI